MLLRIGAVISWLSELTLHCAIVHQNSEGTIVATITYTRPLLHILILLGCKKYSFLN